MSGRPPCVEVGLDLLEFQSVSQPLIKTRASSRLAGAFCKTVLGTIWQNARTVLLLSGFLLPHVCN